MSWKISLPMYDLAEIHGATQQWGQGILYHIQEAGFNEPITWIRGFSARVLWDDPDLLISQCCGFDVVNSYADQLTPLITPHYQALGCEENRYSSVVLVPENSRFQTLEELQGAVAVINETESQSGMNALFTLINPLAQEGHFFSEIKVSGAHVKSLQTVQQGQADAASIDCVTFALLQRYRPESIVGTRILTTTAGAPALPYVTRNDLAPELQQVLQKALLAAFADPQLQAVREALLIKGAQASAIEDYQVILQDFGFDKRLLAGVL